MDHKPVNLKQLEGGFYDQGFELSELEIFDVREHGQEGIRYHAVSHGQKRFICECWDVVFLATDFFP